MVENGSEDKCIGVIEDIAITPKNWKTVDIKYPFAKLKKDQAIRIPKKEVERYKSYNNFLGYVSRLAISRGYQPTIRKVTEGEFKGDVRVWAEKTGHEPKVKGGGRV